MSFSEKQKEILRFPYRDEYDALICDGAVRSGKTSIMSLSFVLWMMAGFNRCSFAFCGKSVGAVERNIIQPLLSVRYLQQQFHLAYNRSGHVLTVRRGDKENRIYLFGGKDESSYMLIQGITLAGVLLDEVALMPRSFVEQALARCSVTGAKYWFNCNPENPLHWFRQEWILKAEKRRALHLHFLMDDNPSLDDKTRERYRNLYAGVFYERYILGRWVMAEGLIYDMLDLTTNTYKAEEAPSASRAIPPAPSRWTMARLIQRAMRIFLMTAKRSESIGNTAGTAAKSTARRPMKSMRTTSCVSWETSRALPS